MQIIEIHLMPGEGEKGVQILKELGIKDFNIIKSESGDQITIRHPLDKTDQISDRFQEEFKFNAEENRGIIFITPEVVLPSQPEKEKKVETSARDCLIEYAETNAYVDSKFIALFFFSAVVATLGLITNNIAVVVGAMIIAPAFGPISSIAIGVVINRMDLFKEGVKTEIIGIGVAVITALVIGLLIPGIEINESLQLRMVPGIFDLLIGLAAGAAGGYVLVSGRNANIVGVMVAAALVPVMAAIGLSFVLLNPFYFFGSLLLLLITVFSIVLSMILVFWFVGSQKEHIHLARDYHLTQDTVKKFIRYASVIIIVLAIPLVWLTYEDLVTRAPEKEINQIFAENIHENLELAEVIVDSKEINVVIYNYDSVDNEILIEIQQTIKNLVDPRYEVRFTILDATRV